MLKENKVFDISLFVLLQKNWYQEEAGISVKLTWLPAKKRQKLKSGIKQNIINKGRAQCGLFWMKISI